MAHQTHYQMGSNKLVIRGIIFQVYYNSLLEGIFASLFFLVVCRGGYFFFFNMNPFAIDSCHPSFEIRKNFNRMHCLCTPGKKILQKIRRLSKLQTTLILDLSLLEGKPQVKECYSGVHEQYNLLTPFSYFSGLIKNQLRMAIPCFSQLQVGKLIRTSY